MTETNELYDYARRSATVNPNYGNPTGYQARQSVCLTADTSFKRLFLHAA